MLHQVGIELRNINRIFQWLAINIIDDFTANIHRNILLRFKGVGTKVRGNHHLRMSDQGFKGFTCRGLSAPHIKSRPSGFTALQCLQHRLFFNDATTRTVDNDDIIFHLAEMIRRDHATRFIIQWCMHGENIGITDQLFQAHQFNAKIGTPFFRDIWVIGNYVHLKRFTT